jgi:hypothetical protein
MSITICTWCSALVDTDNDDTYEDGQGNEICESCADDLNEKDDL